MKLSILAASALSLLVISSSALAFKPDLNVGLPVQKKPAPQVKAQAAALGFTNKPNKTVPAMVSMANGTRYAAATHIWTGGPQITVKAKPTSDNPTLQKPTKKVLWVTHENGIEESGFANKVSTGLALGKPLKATPRANSDYGQVLEYPGGFSVSTAGSDQRVLTISTPWGVLPKGAAKYLVKEAKEGRARGAIISMFDAEGGNGQKTGEKVIVFHDGSGIVYNPKTNAVREAAK
jgi:hypothetical protein